MSSREERIKVFEDTMKWCQDDDYLSASIDTAKKATQVYYEDEYPPLPIKQTVKTEITVSKDRSYQAAIRLTRENPDCRIAEHRKRVYAGPLRYILFYTGELSGILSMRII